MIEFDLQFEVVEAFDLAVDGVQSLDMALDSPIIIREFAGESFDGPYTATPGEDPVVIDVRGKRMMENFVIAPIPTNYGLITWSGSGSPIRVS